MGGRPLERKLVGQRRGVAGGGVALDEDGDAFMVGDGEGALIVRLTRKTPILRGLNFGESGGEIFYAYEMAIGDAAHDIVSGELFRRRFRLILGKRCGV